MKCAFIGHRDADGIEKQIEFEIKNLMQTGNVEFYSGGMGNFDKMCEKTVREFGGRITFVPYNVNQIKEKDKLWYNSIICPFGNKPYSKFDIPNRNKWLVDNCDVFICYVNKPGGAKRTYDYAIKNGKTIINLFDCQTHNNKNFTSKLQEPRI